MYWHEKCVVVTGASSGIGRAVSKLLATKGANLVVVARRAEKLKDLVEELGGSPHSFLVCDVSDLCQVKEMAHTLQRKWPHLDVLINNAGVPSSGYVIGADSESIAQVIGTNLLGPIWCTNELFEMLLSGPRSRQLPTVVQVASMAARVPFPRLGDYVASKYGLVGFAESVWGDLKARGIKSMVVNPGPTTTESFPFRGFLRDPRLSWTVMQPERVARAIVRGIERGSFEVKVQWWMHMLHASNYLPGSVRRRLVTTVGGRYRQRF